jgi:hypothetical protein
MTLCPNCSHKLRKDIENVYEIDDVKYFDLKLICDKCGYTKPATVTRKDPLPKSPNLATEMAASIRLRDYLPERRKPIIQKPPIEGESLRKIFNPLRNLREIFVYAIALIVGLIIEIGGLFFESYLRTLVIYPLVGFVVSLLIFVLGPILIVGGMVFYATRDWLKAILFGSISVPLSIIIIANLRLDVWGI